MTATPTSDRSKVRRNPTKGFYERDALYEILDRHLVAHVGIAVEEGDGEQQSVQPYVIPMFHVRDGDELLLHGSRVSRLVTTLADGIPACVTVTHLDGIVLARSAFDHSLNYRSVVALGTARAITDRAEKTAAAELIVEKLVPGRSAHIRMPDRKELDATEILRFEIAEISGKQRAGGPDDHQDDIPKPIWAGHVPVETRIGEVITDQQGGCPEAVPEHVSSWLAGARLF